MVHAESAFLVCMGDQKHFVTSHSIQNYSPTCILVVWVYATGYQVGIFSLLADRLLLKVDFHLLHATLSELF